MIANEYGVTKVRFSDAPDREHSCVQFGDGMTGIFPLTFGNGDKGLKLCKLEGQEIEPFISRKYQEDEFNGTTDGDEIYLLFDNPKSIDAMISQLVYIKEGMEAPTGEDE